jgi:hypothetical protein
MNDMNTGTGDNDVVVDGSGSTQSTPDTPQPIEITDANAYVKLPGSDKPVKVSEALGFQAQFTKASQRAAALERELNAERQRAHEYQRSRAQAPQQPQGQNEDVFAALRELPYLDGKAAVDMVQGITSQIKQRDQVLMAALTKMQQMERILSGLNENHLNSSFDSKINKWVTDLGYGPEAVEVAKEIYLAYEGNDLDQEFPRIFGDRMKQLENLFEARKRSAIDRARKVPFVPGRGGSAGPSKPLQLKGNESPKDLANLLWDDANGSGT